MANVHASKIVEQYPNTAPLQLLGRTSAGRVYCGTDQAGCVSAAGDFLRAQGGRPRRLLPLVGVGPIACGNPNKRNADGAVGIFR